ncbi:MAG: hypothetical protein NE330_22710 [Lentisphaeraceae bacterium]|nr:hypothetical protein [Lentisphaeraceae bacterium]
MALVFLLLAGFYSFPALYDSAVVKLKTINHYVTLALTSALIHLVFMGCSGWLSISHWPAFLPPVSLIAALFCFYTLSKKLVKSITK